MGDGEPDDGSGGPRAEGFGNAVDMGEIPNARDGDAHRGGVRSSVGVPGDVAEDVGVARLFIDQTLEPALEARRRLRPR